MGTGSRVPGRNLGGASILADELRSPSDTDAIRIARLAGLYLRGLVDLVQGATAESSMAVIKELLNLPPVVDLAAPLAPVAFGVRDGYGRVAAWIAAVLG